MKRKLKMKNHRWFLLLVMFMAGCGQQELPKEGVLVFKGRVVQVQHRLGQGYTLLVDDQGKTTRLEGYPGVPCAEVEIFKRGEQEYEIFQAPPQG